MPGKRLAVLAFGPDRKVWNGDPLTLTVTDIFEARVLHRGKLSGAAVNVDLNLPFDAGQVYGLKLEAPRHLPGFRLIGRRQFIDRGEHPIERDEALLRVTLIPRNATSPDCAAAFGPLRDAGSPFVAPGLGLDEATFLALPAQAHMAFLNIEAKLRATRVNGTPLLSLVTGVRHAAVDRVFLMFRPEAKQMVRMSADFADAPGHRRPDEPPGLPDHPDSWKHEGFGEGNVQLSFSRETEPWPPQGGTPCHSADVDIDLGRGLAHVAEWLHNNVFDPGHKTDQRLVYGLLCNQQIHPFYTLTEAVARARARAAAARPRARQPRARKATTRAAGGRRRTQTRRRSARRSAPK